MASLHSQKTKLLITNAYKSVKILTKLLPGTLKTNEKYIQFLQRTYKSGRAELAQRKAEKYNE